VQAVTLTLAGAHMTGGRASRIRRSSRGPTRALGDQNSQGRSDVPEADVKHPWGPTGDIAGRRRCAPLLPPLSAQPGAPGGRPACGGRGWKTAIQTSLTGRFPSLTRWSWRRWRACPAERSRRPCPTLVDTPLGRDVSLLRL